MSASQYSHSKKEFDLYELSESEMHMDEPDLTELEQQAHDCMFDEDEEYLQHSYEHDYQIKKQQVELHKLTQQAHILLKQKAKSLDPLSVTQIMEQLEIIETQVDQLHGAPLVKRVRKPVVTDPIHKGASARDLLLASRLGSTSAAFFEHTGLCPLNLWYRAMQWHIESGKRKEGFDTPTLSISELMGILNWLLPNPKGDFETQCISRLKQQFPNYLYALFSANSTFEACAYFHQHTGERLLSAQTPVNTSSVYLPDKNGKSELPLLHSIAVQMGQFSQHYRQACHLIGTYYDLRLLDERDSLGFTVLGCINRLLKNSMHQAQHKPLLQLFEILTDMGADPTALHPSLEQIAGHPHILKIAQSFEQKNALEKATPSAPKAAMERVQIKRL